MRADMAGRPTNGTKQYQVQLDPASVERVDALVGTYKRSAFIREAVAEKLAREADIARDVLDRTE